MRYRTVWRLCPPRFRIASHASARELCSDIVYQEPLYCKACKRYPIGLSQVAAPAAPVDPPYMPIGADYVKTS
jgi:hypothetical protein